MNVQFCTIIPLYSVTLRCPCVVETVVNKRGRTISRGSAAAAATEEDNGDRQRVYSNRTNLVNTSCAEGESPALLTHLTIFVHLVVCQLHLLKGYDLFPQSLTADGTVWVRVEASGWRRIGFACDQPWGSVVRVSVAPRIRGHNVQQYGVTVCGLGLSQGARKWYSEGGKHPPAIKRKG